MSTRMQTSKDTNLKVARANNVVYMPPRMVPINCDESHPVIAFKRTGSVNMLDWKPSRPPAA